MPSCATHGCPLGDPLATPSGGVPCKCSRAALHTPSPPDPAATSASSPFPCPSPVAVAEALPPGPAPPWQSCSQEGRSSATLPRLDRLPVPPRTPLPLPLRLLGTVVHTPELRCRVRCREEGSAAGDAAAAGAAVSEAPASASGAKLAAELQRRTRRAVDWGACCGCAPRPPALACARVACDRERGAWRRCLWRLLKTQMPVHTTGKAPQLLPCCSGYDFRLELHSSCCAWHGATPMNDTVRRRGSAGAKNSCRISPHARACACMRKQCHTRSPKSLHEASESCQ